MGGNAGWDRPGRMTLNGTGNNIAWTIRINGAAERFTMKPERVSGMLPMRKMVHPVDGFFLESVK
jgi:hypothetical protein